MEQSLVVVLELQLEPELHPERMEFGLQTHAELVELVDWDLQLGRQKASLEQSVEREALQLEDVAELLNLDRRLETVCLKAQALVGFLVELPYLDPQIVVASLHQQIHWLKPMPKP